MKKYINKSTFLFCIAIILFAINFQFAFSDISGNYNSILIHNTDEWNAFNYHITNLNKGYFSPQNFYSYGCLHSFLAFKITEISRQILTLSISHEILIFRSISTLSAFLIIFLLFRIATNNFKYGFWLSIISSIFPFLFFQWQQHTVMIKPDMLLLMFITLGFYFITSMKYGRKYWIASLFIGLATGVKITGLYSFVIVLVAIVLDINSEKNGPLKIKHFLKFGYLFIMNLLIVILTWSITNIWAILDFKDLAGAMKWESGDKQFTFYEAIRFWENDYLDWFKYIADDSSWIVVFLIAISIFYNLLKIRIIIQNPTNKFNHIDRNKFILYSMFLIIFIYSLFIVKFRDARYLYSILIFGGLMIVDFISNFKKLKGKLTVIAFAFCFYLGVLNVFKHFKYREVIVEKVSNEIKRYDSFKKLIPKEIINSYVYTDAYCFMPDSATRFRINTFWLSSNDIDRLKPGLVVFSKLHFGRYYWIKQNTKYSNIEEIPWIIQESKKGGYAKPLNVVAELNRINKLLKTLINNKYRVLYSDDYLFVFSKI